jgi:MraZ protein
MQSQGRGVVALFLSTYDNKVDRKGRVSVPAAWRPALSQNGFAGIVCFPSFKYEAVEGCDHAWIAEMSARHDTLDQFSEDADSLALIFAGSHQLAFDPEGRIMLPEPLMQHAGITERAVFVGTGRTFQIWEPDRWEKHAADMRERARTKGLTLPGRRLPEAPR